MLDKKKSALKLLINDQESMCVIHGYIYVFLLQMQGQRVLVLQAVWQTMYNPCCHHDKCGKEQS